MAFLQPGKEWDQLYQFLGGYFHQDWDLDHESIEDAVIDAAPDFDHHLLAEFQRVRGLGLDDAGHRALLSRLGCYISPEARGMTPSQLWELLEHLARAHVPADDRSAPAD